MSDEDSDALVSLSPYLLVSRLSCHLAIVSSCVIVSQQRNTMSTSLPFSLQELQEHFGAALIPSSFVAQDAVALGLDRAATGKRLAILARADDPLLARFNGDHADFRAGYSLKICAT